jgi:hypothetical protein
MILIVIVIILYFRDLGNYRFVFINKIFIEFPAKGYV